TLADSLREVDLAARYGGEEFAILLPQTDKQGAMALALRLQKSVQALKVALDAQVLRVGVSVGVACATDIAEGSADDLVRAADAALYGAKRDGRNRVVAYDPEKHILGALPAQAHDSHQ